MPRCTATTKVNRRCRLSASGAGTLCVVHKEPQPQADPTEWRCLLCDAPMTQELFEETEGYCSYACSSGGGYGSRDCSGCTTNQPNQMAHTGPSGCLAEPEPEPLFPWSGSRHDWCAKTADHKHVNGPAEAIGNSWHGPVWTWECTECHYRFSDH